MKKFYLFILLISATVSFACDCLPQTMAEQVSRADLIFIGTPLKRTVKKKTIPPSNFSYEVAEYLFVPERIFKGNHADTLTLETGIDGAACGIEFEIGKAYVVYAKNKITGYCTRTGLAATHPDLTALRRSRLPIL